MSAIELGQVHALSVPDRGIRRQDGEQGLALVPAAGDRFDARIQAVEKMWNLDVDVGDCAELYSIGKLEQGLGVSLSCPPAANDAQTPVPARGLLTA